MASHDAEPALTAPVDRARASMARIAEATVRKAVGALNKLAGWLDKKINEGVAIATGRRPLYTQKGAIGRPPIVHRFERNPRTDDATVASHIMHAVRGVKDPKLQEKGLQTLDLKQLRLLNRHANHIGGTRAKPVPDGLTRRTCNAVHEATRRRLGDMSTWSGNAADRIPSPDEQKRRVVSDMMRAPSPKSYVKDCTPKERRALEYALGSELHNSDGWAKSKIERAMEMVERARTKPDKPRYAPPRTAARGNTAPAVVRGADRAAGGAAKAASRPEPAMTR